MRVPPDSEREADGRSSVGSAVVRRRPTRLLQPATGFLRGYTHTLNPYVGCAFGCAYCYVRRMPVALFRGRPWGAWLEIKEGAAALLVQELRAAKRKGPVTIFMSSATDPYQPAEFRERVTRGLLTAMLEEPPDALFVQTRSPLVVRDVDLFRGLREVGTEVLVSVTVETDRDDVRRAFAPASPPIAARLGALARLRAAGVPTQAAVAPVLPCTERFASLLARVTDLVVIDDYWMGDGSGGRRTERLGVRAVYERLGLADWYSPDAWRGVAAQLVSVFGESRVRVSCEGFRPTS